MGASAAYAGLTNAALTGLPAAGTAAAVALPMFEKHAGWRSALRPNIARWRKRYRGRC
jgi:hypothetical protein